MQCQEFQNRVGIWRQFAADLTTVIQAIIEFAKMIDGFMRLGQEEQIHLLKGKGWNTWGATSCEFNPLSFLSGGVFELAVVELSSRYSPETQTLSMDNIVLPLHNLTITDQIEVSNIVSNVVFCCCCCCCGNYKGL